jgi:hypothetical protein
VWIKVAMGRALQIMSNALMPYTTGDSVLPFYTLAATTEAPPGRQLLSPRHTHTFTSADFRLPDGGRPVTLQSLRFCDGDHPWSGFHCATDTTATDEQACHLLSFAFAEHAAINRHLFAVLVHLYHQTGAFISLKLLSPTTVALSLFNDDHGTPVNSEWLTSKLQHPTHAPPLFCFLKVHNVMNRCVHAVMLAAYPQRRCVYWFDPHAGSGGGECIAPEGKHLSPAVSWVQENILRSMPQGSRLKFAGTGAAVGPQTLLGSLDITGSWFFQRVKSTCGAWTTWMLHLLLKFPHLTPNELLRQVYDLVGGATPAAMYHVIVQFLGDCLRFIDPVLVQVEGGRQCIKSRRVAGVQFLPCEDAPTGFDIMRLVLQLHVRPEVSVTM